VKRGQERQAEIERWAAWIESRSLSPVALSLLEMGEACAFLVSHALFAIEPLVRGSSTTGVEKAVHLLSSPERRRLLRNRLASEHISDE